MSDPVLQCDALSRSYHSGGFRLTVLSNVTLSVAAGEQIAIVGASGTGKSTLLHLLGALDSPDAGSIRWGGQLISELSVPAQAALRNRMLGFVYQFHHLLPEFSALENVAMPLRVRRMAASEATPLAESMLKRVGLAERLSHRPGQLSGGERQRVALARALVSSPACVLADEPTGNLDRSTARRMFDLIADLRRELGTAFVIVTHDEELASRADRVLALSEGRLVARS
ncbi:MAG: ATP-binding cassette domain-containing protein [Betaproteobacteria bacterium]|nr:ATP-binding cassette domain-containing protein [Betaproteobacteria bacterium]